MKIGDLVEFKPYSEDCDYKCPMGTGLIINVKDNTPHHRLKYHVLWIRSGYKSTYSGKFLKVIS